jgi:trans-2,3-dihydro-3-hydroxyanthranilate isomerase
MKSENIKTLSYYILDVFTEHKFQGNPLSVVLCENELELKLYKDIAREFGYAETSFVWFSPEKGILKVRSFTPGGFEVNGAGHNLLGAVALAVLKGWNKLDNSSDGFSVIMKDKCIPVITRLNINGLPFISMLQQPAVIIKPVATDIIAPAIGLAPDALIINDWIPLVVKTEVAHLLVPVKNVYELNSAGINKSILKAVSAQVGFQGCYLFTVDSIPNENIAEARFFNPGIGIDEDAATGSAAGPLAGYLTHYNFIRREQRYHISQGVTMNQPSKIDVEIADDGIWVSGTAVITMEGKLYL